MTRRNASPAGPNAGVVRRHPDRENRPLESETVQEILRAADRCRRYFQQILQDRGLTLQQYNVLRILRGAGPEGLPTLEVGERMIEKTPGVTRLLDRLEAQGLVHRWRGKQDRRCVYCTATPRALTLLDTLDAPIRQADRSCVERLSPRDCAELIRLAQRVLERAEPTPTFHPPTEENDHVSNPPSDP